MSTSTSTRAGRVHCTARAGARRTGVRRVQPAAGGGLVWERHGSWLRAADRRRCNRQDHLLRAAGDDDQSDRRGGHDNRGCCGRRDLAGATPSLAGPVIVADPTNPTIAALSAACTGDFAARRDLAAATGAERPDDRAPGIGRPHDRPRGGLFLGQDPGLLPVAVYPAGAGRPAARDQTDRGGPECQQRLLVRDDNRQSVDGDLRPLRGRHRDGKSAERGREPGCHPVAAPPADRGPPRRQDGQAERPASEDVLGPRITGQMNVGGAGRAGTAYTLLAGSRRVAAGRTNAIGSFTKLIRIRRTTSFQARTAVPTSQTQLDCVPIIPLRAGTEPAVHRRHERRLCPLRATSSRVRK